MGDKNLIAVSTQRPDNSFDVKIYVAITPEGTLQPLARRQRRRADHVVKLKIEYPTYEEEIGMRQRATVFDERNQVHYTDFAKLTEERVRCCLVKWDLHEKIPGLTKRLHRLRRELEDDSMELWKNLPPLLRKTIAEEVNMAIGMA